MPSQQASALASAPHEIQGQQHNYKAFRDIFRARVPRLQPPEARKGNLARKSRSAAQCSRANLVTGANENRNRRSEVAKNEEMLTLSWTALEARSSIPHASPEECLDGTPWEAQSRKPRLRGKDLGSGCLRKDGFDARLERHRAGEGYSYGCPVF